MSFRNYKEGRLNFLYNLREEELKALEMLDIARNTGDPVTQTRALDLLRRTMIDFAFETYLDFMSYGGGYTLYKINYSYFTEWKEGKMKSIHSEIECLENQPKMKFPSRFD